MAGEKIRLGTVGFVNAWPLTLPLEGREDIEVLSATPVSLGPLLRAGRVDAALLPVAAHLHGADLERIPGIGVAARGKVRSVLLLHRLEVASLQRVGCDFRSVTSTALLRILFEGRFCVRPLLAPWNPYGPLQGSGLDGALVIGDRALEIEEPSWRRLDLAEAWWEWKGRPFVFAAWVARRGHPRRAEIEKILTASRDEGVERLALAAERAAQRGGRDRAFWFEYLSAIRYHVGPEEEAGLQEFADEMRRRNLVADPTRILVSL